MNNYVLVLCVLYIILITYFVGKLLMKPSSEGLTAITEKSTKKKKKKKEQSTVLFDREILDEDADADGDMNNTDPMLPQSSSDDDALFNRQANRTRFISNNGGKATAGSGKNLQYNMLKDNFQIVEGAPAMADYGA